MLRLIFTVCLINCVFLGQLFATNYYTRDSPPTRGCFGFTSYSNTSHAGAAGLPIPAITPLGDTIFANHMGCTTVDTTAAGISSGCDCTFGPSIINGVLIVRSGARFVWNGTLTLNSGASLIIEPGAVLELNGSVVFNAGSSALVDGSFEMNGSMTNRTNITGAGCFVCNGSVVNQLGGTFFGDGTTPIGCAAGNACTNVVLPVDLAYVKAITRNGATKLEWATISETNSDYFTIMRSFDGINYSPIGTVQSAGTSSQFNSYMFTDTDPYSGTAYYMLRQTDFDGSSEDFDPVSVFYSGGEWDVALYPSPVVNELNYRFENLPSDKISVSIYNESGQQMKTIYHEAVNYMNYSLDLESYAKGIYLIDIRSGSQRISRKVIK